MILNKVANYITDVLDYDISKIIIGRENFIQKDYETSYIYVDSLAPAQSNGRNESYDYNVEDLTLGTEYQQTFTIDFVGTNAQLNMINFVNLQDSERAYDSKISNGIDVFNSNNVNKIDDKVGKKFYERWQLEILIKYTHQTSLETPYFETAQTVLNINK